jgi:hypothetical protein
MSLQHIKVKSVNVRRDNKRIHALLNDDTDTHIFLIQEPWYGTVATLRSDTDPTSKAQLGPTINPAWDVHLPKLAPGEACKALAYTRRSLLQSHVVHNDVTHPLANTCSLVLDIKDDNDTILKVVNTYHSQPATGHNLQYLLQHELDPLTPTLLIGDFNTHSPRWSLPDHTPSPWAHDFENWLDDNGLADINPPGIPTWHSGQEGD